MEYKGYQSSRLANMAEDKLITASDDLLGLNPNVLNKLNTYEDLLGYYIQIEETSSAFHWLKADILNELSLRYGEKSLEDLSNAIHQPRGTISNYIRTSRAYSKDQRLPNISFSHHFQACFADAYDQKKGFVGDKRFEWVAKAADENWSTRKLRDAILTEKETLPTQVKQCNYCGKTDGEISEYIVYKLGIRKDPERFNFHDSCFLKAKILIKKF